ncbi:MAG: type II toxin-antitoxin system RelE/ParE family toxin [Gemmatimonadota bacterium]|nr:type II toxin-antitoxin system RelE/ParE family toxin [Gemmatimonadota bacterium]
MPGRWIGIEFIYTPSFERSARRLLDDESMRRAELALVAEPRAGAVVAGAGVIRKLRVALPGRGKRGSARVAYLYVEARGRIYFLLAYAKGDQVDLTAADRKLLRQLARELEASE